MPKKIHTRHGGAFDRGSADYYYWREFSPHYYIGDTYNSPKVEESSMTEEEVAAYQAGWDDAEAHGDRKDYNQELAYNKDMPGRTKYTIERKSPFTGMVNQMEIELDPNDYVNWKHGMNIQDALPYLTADEREFIKTGITPEDWAAEFPEPCQELRYNNSMTIKQLKAVITWMEKEQLIGPSTPVIIGKHGTSGVLDGPEVQKEVTSTDIQAIPGGEAIAFTLVHK